MLFPDSLYTHKPLPGIVWRIPLFTHAQSAMPSLVRDKQMARGTRSTDRRDGRARYSDQRQKLWTHSHSPLTSTTKQRCLIPSLANWKHNGIVIPVPLSGNRLSSSWSGSGGACMTGILASGLVRGTSATCYGSAGWVHYPSPRGNQ